MRTQKAMTNIKMAMIYQISVLFMSFVDRKLFLEILGVEYLGIHGLFNNMISMLALAELGVGTAIIYNLYKPLADNDEDKVAALMKFYRKMYFYIGGIILVLGFAMLASIPFFIKDVSVDMRSIHMAYGIFVIGTVGTYWTGYKRSLLYADQKNYKVLVGDMSATVGGAVVKILVLITYPSYILYVLVHIIAKIIPNLYAAFRVNKEYPYLKQSKQRLTNEEKLVVKTNVKDLFIHKVAFFVVNSTDNMIISWFSGVTMVGFIGNYQVIVSAVMSFIGQGIEALQASIGNMVTTKEKEEITIVYKKVEFVVFWIASWSVVCLMGLINPFIELWLGSEYLMSSPIMWVMILNFMLWVMTRPLWQMMSVSGLFKEDKYNALAEMLTNLVISLILVQKIGVIGVLIGTSFSYLIAWLLKARVLYSKFFKDGFKEYIIRMITYVGIIVAEVVLVKWILGYVVVEKKLLTFVLQAAVCMVVPNVINILLFYKNEHFIYFKTLIKEQIDKVQSVHKYDGIITKAIVALIMIIPLHNTAFPIGSLIGRFSSVALAMIGMGYAAYQGIVLGNISKKRQKHVIAYLIFCVLLIIYGMVTGGDEGLKIAANIISVTCIGVACALMDWSRLGRGIYLVDIGVLVWAYFMLKELFKWRKLEESGWLNYQFIFKNTNTLGLIVAFLIFILALAYSQKRGERYVLYSVLLLPILIESNSRTAMIALMAMIGMYIIGYTSSKWVVSHWLVWIVMIVGIISITLIYPRLGEWESVGRLNQIVSQISNKNLFSGREKLWLDTMAIIKERPFVGYGLQATLENFTQDNLSTHNQYLQILLQSGWIGLSLVGALFTGIWRLGHKGRKLLTVRMSMSIIVGVLVVACFENTLMGESISLGLMQWAMIGIGVSQVVLGKVKG